MVNLDELSRDFVSEFQKKFYDKKTSNIVLYGIGKNSSLLLEMLSDYNFIGLMDKNPDNIGKKMPFGGGIYILDVDEVIKNADIIIITASEIYWQIIFKRIAYLTDIYNIPIYYPNGNRASEDIVHFEDNSYWQTTSDILFTKIDSHEVISFDIFDTLIMRKTVSPEDIFSLVELRLKNKFEDLDFVNFRKLASEEAYRIKGNFTNLHDIYEQLQMLTGLSNEDIIYIKNIEISVEYEVVVPRNDVVKAFQYALSKGKNIYFLSDMYLPRDILDSILIKCGITGYYELWISCEFGLNKHDMTMWYKYREVNYGKSCLHIGDNLRADIENAHKVNIDTVHVFSSFQILLHSSLKEIVPYITTLNESLLLGCIISRLFNSPFSLNTSKGKVYVKNLLDLGYLGFGALVLNYLIWILKENTLLKQEKILFFARDGYLLQKIYKYIIDSLNIKYAPEGVYFKISRRMAMIAAINDNLDMFNSAIRHEYQGNFGDYLQKRFNVIPDVDDINTHEMINSFTDYDKILLWINKYKEKILQNAKVERRNYINYILKLGIFNSEKVSIVDLFFNGTGQYYLSKITNKKYEGFYLCALLGENNIYGLGKNMHALYQNIDDPKAIQSNMRKYSQLIESVLTAPEGMYIKCDENGIFHNADKCFNQRVFSEKEKIHEGIWEYVHDIMSIYMDIDLKHIPYSSLFVDKLFGAVFCGKCELDQSLKDTFSHDDELFGFTERKIWD